jgi:hypothetical protein
MPAGGISRRPLHVIILADCSGSMKGETVTGTRSFPTDPDGDGQVPDDLDVPV